MDVYPFWLNRAQALRSSGIPSTCSGCAAMRTNEWDYETGRIVRFRLLGFRRPYSSGKVLPLEPAAPVLMFERGRLFKEGETCYIANDSRYLLDVNMFLGFAMNLQCF